MIIVPQHTPSPYQKEKALRCVVQVIDNGYEIWDPKVDSTHIVNKGCDCIGYKLRQFCSHMFAVECWEKRERNPDRTIEELFETHHKI